MEGLAAVEAHSLVDVATSELCAEARRLRSLGHAQLVTYSPKVFIPLTKLCRDVCHYCTFARPPRRGERAYMTADEVLAVAREGAAAGCHEALFTLGDKPELRYRVAREELAALGCETTLEYLARMARLVLEETGLLPHLNPGVMSLEDLRALREVSVSQGIMLESISTRLAERGGPHFGSPDKQPERRLETIAAAGEARVPFTTGILIGIGETRAERIDALLAIRELGERYGHIQEVIVQNFRAKPGTRMAGHAEPSLDELLWTAAAARIVLGPNWNIQAPPNLSYDDFPRLLDAGINDWGGVSPVTIDHVNPEAPWPEVEHLQRETQAKGLELAPRLAVYPEYVAELERWSATGVSRHVLDHADGDGLAREDAWAAGASVSAPFFPRDALPVDTRDELGEEELVRLFQARGGKPTASTPPPTGSAARSAATRSPTSSRATSTTRTSATSAAVSAPSPRASSRRTSAGRPYLLPVDEIVRRSTEAWERGAVEVCLQGGIHPGFTGDFYVEVCEAIKAALPELHVHAFSALEVWQGAATLGPPARGLSRAPARSGPGVAARDRRGDPRRRDTPRHLSRQGDDRAVAPRPRRGSPGRPALDDDDHVRPRRRAAELGPAPGAPARPAARKRWLHGVRPASVRAHGSADLPQGPRPARARPSAKRCSSTRSAGSRSIRGSRTSRPRGSSSGSRAPRRSSRPGRTTSAGR